MDPRHFVIVGGGTCAGSAASTLRAEGFDGAVTIVSDEPVPPYERPPLSKDYLTGKTAAEDLAINPAGWYADHGVELLLDTHATRLDTASAALTLGEGRDLHYDALLLATGGRPRQLPDLASDRVLYLRGITDAQRLAQQLCTGERVVVLGGGFIGCEVAASARGLGLEVTVLEMQDVPLQRVLGPDLGEIVAQIHRDAGVEVRTGERVESVRDTGTGLHITTDRGGIDCGALLVAAGLQPNSELAQAAGISCDNGILVDAYCRTDAAGVYAAGDVASHFHPHYNRHIRVEHHDNAIKQGAAAARNMLGRQAIFADQHWFWSDQYEHYLQSVGIATGYDEIVLRGNPTERRFSAFFCQGGLVVSVFALNRGKDFIAGRKLLAAGIPVTAEQLRDEDVNLGRLIPRSTSRTATSRTARPGA